MTPPTAPADEVGTWLTQEVRPAVDGYIERSVQSHRYHDRLWYQVETGGKRLRPGLVLLISDLCGLGQSPKLDSAAAIELLHTFSLIHDDLVDGDRVRREEPAFWVEYGTDDAVNIGDLLLVYALSLVPEGGKSVALEAVHGMAVGQQLDFELSDRRDVTEAEYMEMVKYKTGALLELCLSLPQILTDTDLGIDGYNALWPAFQIRDDLLDFEAGKGRAEIGNDVRAGKRTLMAIHADDDRVYDILDKPAAETTDEEIETVQKIFEETNSFEYARQRMDSLATEALTALESLPDTPQRHRLIALGRFCTDRDH
ncbi:polyprenyl synthetase family protein [Halocatena halophila]|uniref:polyprenyl synthetase family protein n=1 Tax=Halocatena halophila TaxID=2814576 RepID=UPI002ED255D5